MLDSCMGMLSDVLQLLLLLTLSESDRSDEGAQTKLFTIAQGTSKPRVSRKRCKGVEVHRVSVEHVVRMRVIVACNEDESESIE